MAGSIETSASRLTRDHSVQPAERVDREWTNLDTERKVREYQ